MPTQVFILHALDDEPYKQKIQKQLRVLEFQDRLVTWTPDKILAGSDWQAELERELAASGIVLLLITAEFLSSELILNRDVPRAFERHRSAGLRIVPVLCRPCVWQAVSWLTPLAIWPSTQQPIWQKDTDDPEQLLSELARDIANLVAPPKAALRGQDPPTETLTQKLTKIEAQQGHSLHALAEMIRTTIKIGRQIYNDGDAAGCVAVYRQLVDFMLPKAEAALQRGAMRRPQRMGDPAVPKRQPMGRPEPMSEPEEDDDTALQPSAEPIEIQHAIVNELRIGRGDPRSRATADDMAWQLRRCFNRLLFLAEGVNLCSERELRASGRSERNARQLASALLRLLDEISDECGRETGVDYETGVHTSAVLGLLACRALAQDLEPHIVLSSDRAAETSARHLALVMEARDPLSRPYQTLWECRLFLRSLMRLPT